MASPAESTARGAPTVPPDADPGAIRRALSPRLAEEFDVEWAHALDQAKASMNLTGIYQLLLKWRGIAAAEQRDPGAHFRLLAKAEQILQTGQHPGAVPVEDLHALIGERLGR
ncbi:DUF6247 family protein [Amycolatopsis sp. H20-H5]|uniref:DUF6247 family protein n=1 Tax=Amycolatopsis sp. H20-H5 TaxID=3046309 RepID=UPI002DB9433F|nr:DUF6247 family protein [Amycolatopsis sp. H20-H5]MEC3977721.1 DUF6247 family protein [Amycolatopsis sp. H20-H5]